LFFNKDYKTARVPVLEKFSGKLAQLNQFVGPKGHVLDYLTLADFLVAEDSYYIEAMFPE
jgi:uracil-DNA glycosylase